MGPDGSFFCTEIRAEGLPVGEGIPSEEDLFAALNCQKGGSGTRPEGDVLGVFLLATARGGGHPFGEGPLCCPQLPEGWAARDCRPVVAWQCSRWLCRSCCPGQLLLHRSA